MIFQFFSKKKKNIFSESMTEVCQGFHLAMEVKLTFYMSLKLVSLGSQKYLVCTEFSKNSAVDMNHFLIKFGLNTVKHWQNNFHLI